MRIDYRPTPAPTLSGLTAESVYGGIQLRWVVPIDDTFFATEIWASQTNDRANATLIDTVIGTTYYFITDPEIVWYFWIRSSNKFGRTDGTWFPDSETPTYSDTGWLTNDLSDEYNYSGTGDWSNLTNVTVEDTNVASATVNSGNINDVVFYDFDVPTPASTAVLYKIEVKVKANWS